MCLLRPASGHPIVLCTLPCGHCSQLPWLTMFCPALRRSGAELLAAIESELQQEEAIKQVAGRRAAASVASLAATSDGSSQSVFFELVLLPLMDANGNGIITKPELHSLQVRQEEREREREEAEGRTG
jgi:hypothetical protein